MSQSERFGDRATFVLAKQVALSAACQICGVAAGAECQSDSGLAIRDMVHRGRFAPDRMRFVHSYRCPFGDHLGRTPPPGVTCTCTPEIRPVVKLGIALSAGEPDSTVMVKGVAACSPRFALTQDAPRLVYGINGCACGAAFAPAIDDNAWLAHAAAMSASGGGASPAVADCMRAVSQPTEESDGERAVRAMKLQWARDVAAPRPTAMPSLAARLGTTHDDLMRAAIAWALADRVADANADVANTCAHSLREAKERLATVEANASIGFDPVHESEQVAVMEDRYNRASIALDIASAAEQKADEAFRAIAKRLLAELGL